MATDVQKVARIEPARRAKEYRRLSRSANDPVVAAGLAELAEHYEGITWDAPHKIDS